MPQQKKPKLDKSDLLDDLLGTNDAQLEETVEHAEGVNGATVEPVYSVRKMRCYSVTESELKQIGLANLGITAFASIGSGLLAFYLDIFKDTILAEEVPATAKSAIEYVQPILLFLGVSFWALAFAALVWRRSMVQTIKEESR